MPPFVCTRTCQCPVSKLYEEKELDKRGRNENSNNVGYSINKRNLYRIFNNTSGTNDKSKFGDYIYADVFVFK
nr:MAG TPA: hypothetical protein [Caudoviricetes sp.]